MPNYLLHQARRNLSSVSTKGQDPTPQPRPQPGCPFFLHVLPALSHETCNYVACNLQNRSIVLTLAWRAGFGDLIETAGGQVLENRGIRIHRGRNSPRFAYLPFCPLPTFRHSYFEVRRRTRCFRSLGGGRIMSIVSKSDLTRSLLLQVTSIYEPMNDDIVSANELETISESSNRALIVPSSLSSLIRASVDGANLLSVFNASVYRK